MPRVAANGMSGSRLSSVTAHTLLGRPEHQPVGRNTARRDTARRCSSPSAGTAARPVWFYLVEVMIKKNIATCVTCGTELHPERAKKYNYCMSPECQAKNLKGLTMVAVGVNKSAEQYLLLDDETKADLADGKYHDQRRGTFGRAAPAPAPPAPTPPAPSSVPASSTPPASAARPDPGKSRPSTRPAPARPAGPRQP